MDSSLWLFSYEATHIPLKLYHEKEVVKLGGPADDIFHYSPLHMESNEEMFSKRRTRTQGEQQHKSCQSVIRSQNLKNVADGKGFTSHIGI